MNAATRQDHASEDRFERLCAEVEEAWVSGRDATLVERLAEENREYADALYEFFELVLDAELEAEREEGEETAASIGIRQWLDREGFQLAREIAARESAGGPTETTPGGPPPSSSGSGHVTAPEGAGDEPGGTPPLVGLLRDHSRQRLDEIARRLEVNKAFLTQVSEHPDVVPLGVRREIARRAERGLQLGFDRAMASMAGKIHYERAASRNAPYQAETLSYENLLDRSGMTREERAYWLSLARGDDR